MVHSYPRLIGLPIVLSVGDSGLQNVSARELFMISVGVSCVRAVGSILGRHSRASESDHDSKETEKQASIGGVVKRPL